MIRVIADSSCDLTPDAENNLRIAPLTIMTETKQYPDDENLDVAAMLDELSTYTGRTTTACPSIGAWMEAMEGAAEIIIVTITSHLSGAYNAAVAAKELYLQQHPQAKIAVLDSLSTGPEMRLLVEKIQELSASGLSFEAVEEGIRAYSKRTRLFFTLQSLHNMAQNGRVSKIVAAAVGVLGIRIIGTASTEGELEPLSKVRGDRKAIPEMIAQLKNAGFKGGKVRIAHIQAKELAGQYADAIRAAFPTAEIKMKFSSALCSFYAERNGIMIGIETE